MTHHLHVISHRRIASYLISSQRISERRHSSHHFAQPVCFFWAKCKRIFVNVAHRAALHARVNARIPSASSCELPESISHSTQYALKGAGGLLAQQEPRYRPHPSQRSVSRHIAPDSQI